MSKEATQFVAGLPFCAKIGLEAEAEDHVALPDDPTLQNHVGTVHAGALFTLGEAASGVPIAEVVTKLGAMPIAKSASINYRRPANGRIRAHGKIAEDLDAVGARLKANGKTVLDVNVSLTDAAGTEVATMTVTWHLRA